MAKASAKQQQILKEGYEKKYIDTFEYRRALDDSKYAYELVGVIFEKHRKMSFLNLITMSMSNDRLFSSEDCNGYMNGIHCADDM